LKLSRLSAEQTDCGKLFQPTTSGRTALPTEFFCPTGFLCMAGPSVWNSLPEYLRDPAVGKDSFRKQLKTFLFARTNAYSALEIPRRCAI